jgi:ABC-2 type transport system permease protein
MIRGSAFFAPVDGATIHVVRILWMREVLVFLSDRSQLLGALSRTFLWLIILGFGLGATLREIEGYTYSQYILPGVMVLNILFASLQSAFGIIADRKFGIFRQVMVSPTSSLTLTLGKLSGAATVSLIHGAVPLLFAPIIGISFPLENLLLILPVMFLLSFGITGIGLIIAVRVRGFLSFGAISNGLIQPLYFLSGAIFPLKGIVGGIGFLDIPGTLRDELRNHGVYAISGGWIVELPYWLEVIVKANPISYFLDILRQLILNFSQLNQEVAVYCCLFAPCLGWICASIALGVVRRG